MGHDFELAEYTRLDDIYDKDMLLAPLPEGAVAGPHPMVEGFSDKNYYLGEVTGPTEEQVEWVREHRPDDPSLKTAKPVKYQDEQTTKGSKEDEQ